MPRTSTYPSESNKLHGDVELIRVPQLLETQLDHAFGLVHLSLCDYEAALSPLLRAARAGEAGWVPAVVPDLVEAGVRTGHRDLVRRAAASLVDSPLVEPTALARGLVARVGALMADDEAADPLYRLSTLELVVAGDGVALARTQLVHGEWLRRHHRRHEAREVLQAACAGFEATPSKAFAVRAHAEFLAAGGSDGEAGGAAFGLSPREHQVAVRAARGCTNREIAASLYVSTWTVDFHLRKVFRKLGIRSRRQLAGVLARASGWPLSPSLAQPA